MSRFPGLAGRLGLLGAAAAVGLALPLALQGAAFAQKPPAAPSPAASPPAVAPPAAAPVASAPAAATTAPADPVVATVDGQPIHLSDLNQAAQILPPQLREIPPQTLFPMLLDQQIDRKALVIEARKTGLDKDPVVQRQIALAVDTTLQNALLQRQVAPSVSEEAVRARYDKELAGKPGEPEVHARHILVPTEEEAKKVIAELKKGGDFAALAKQYSKDPGASQGGDLGWFKKDEMVPAFADAAFAMKPGDISDKPIKTEFGWHVIKVEDKRQAPPPSFDQAKDGLRQKLIQEGVQKVVQQARADIKVERFNMDGSPLPAAPLAAPAPATPPAASAPATKK